MEVGVVVKRGSLLALELAEKAVEVLKSHGVRVLVEEKSVFGPLSSLPRFSLVEEKPEYIVAIGGDGTLLRTALHIREESAILGIKAGKRGFLMEIDRFEVEERLKDFAEGRFKIVEYSRLDVSLNGERFACILNDAAVLSTMAKIVRLNTLIDGEVAMRLDGDGVIVATSVGSTAHSLSAGGPIVDPRLDVVIVVPVNPIQLYLRPIVVPYGSQIDIHVSEQSNEAVLSLDGQIQNVVRPGSIITVLPCKWKLRVVKLKGLEGFYERVYSRILMYW
ncbi:MAG: NAD(+)/NADH kinase [Acidilobaceae archaeon]